MNLIRSLEKALQHLTDASECICNEDLQDDEVQALLSEIQSTMDAMTM